MMDPEITTEQLRQEVITVDRVSRVVAGGRRFRFRALVVVGDGQGGIGVGVAKAGEVSAAVDKAAARAKRDQIKFPLTASGTLPHTSQARFAGAEVLLKPAGPGTGVIAGGAVRQVLEVAGVRDVLSKAFGSANKLNNCYATLAALTQLKALPVRTKSDSASEQTGTKSRSTVQSKPAKTSKGQR
ncbi:30S ribosomal protein S5 [Candidatus Microgenomates bacterium]|nr:30S ribosomal protein S5 [Candidatus Microgenomates bacterium]